MSTYVRLFFFTSIVAAAVIAAAFMLYRQDEVDQLVKLAESQNVGLARSISGTIWPQIASFVESASQMDADTLRTHPKIREIRDGLSRASEGLPVLKIKIYDSRGFTVFSTEPSEIGQDKRNNPGIFSAAQQGKPASKLTFRHAVSTFEGTIQNRDLVESYLPIRRNNGPVEGIFELYSDVTDVLAAAQRPANLMVGLSVMLGTLYFFLFLIVQRADQTIKRQYADIMENNAALEREVGERERAQRALKESHDELENRVEERTRKLTEEIAERKRAEDEVRRHRNELAHFGRISVMGEMATNLAHELNQPLTVISGCAQVCLDELRSDENPRARILDSVEQVAEQADRANQIIKRIRGFVRKGEQERGKIDVNQTIHDIADLLQSDAREHDTDVALELADDLPAVIADSIQIQQVILNLAHNGMEAMNDKRPDARRVMIQTSAHDRGVVEVAVCDEGRGIPTDSLARLFEPFYTTKTDGLGMGLSISRSIVEAHGGRLWAESDGRSGTVFSFSLPTVEANPRDDT